MLDQGIAALEAQDEDLGREGIVARGGCDLQLADGFNEWRSILLDDGDMISAIAEDPIQVPDGLSRGDQIGQGSMGTVYALRQIIEGVATDTEAIVKILGPPDTYKRPDQHGNRVRALVSEARAMSLIATRILGDKNIKHRDVLVVGPTPYVVFPDDKIGLVAPKFNKGDLKSLMATSEFLNSNRSGLDLIDLMRDPALAIALLHKAGLIHRDVKPSNIYLRESGDRLRAGLGDFSTSGELNDVVSSKLFMSGTPAYMAPELFLKQLPDNERIAFSNDVYSLGVVFFELLTGRMAFWNRGNKIGEVLRNHRRHFNGNGHPETWEDYCDLEKRSRKAFFGVVNARLPDDDEMFGGRDLTGRNEAECLNTYLLTELKILAQRMIDRPENRPDADEVLAELSRIRNFYYETVKTKGWITAAYAKIYSKSKLLNLLN